MTKVKDILVTVLLVILVLAAGKWAWEMWFPSNVAVTRTPVAVTTPVTKDPVRPFFTSDKGFPGPSILEAQNLLHVNVVRVGTELSTFNWRGFPQNIELFMAKGFIFTVHTVKDEVVVIVGNDKPTRTKGFTARYIDVFPQADAVHRPADLAQKEQIHLRESNPNAIVTVVTELPLP